MSGMNSSFFRPSSRGGASGPYDGGKGGGKDSAGLGNIFGCKGGGKDSEGLGNIFGRPTPTPPTAPPPPRDGAAASERIFTPGGLFDVPSAAASAAATAGASAGSPGSDDTDHGVGRGMIGRTGIGQMFKKQLQHDDQIEQLEHKQQQQEQKLQQQEQQLQQQQQQFDVMRLQFDWLLRQLDRALPAPMDADGGP